LLIEKIHTHYRYCAHRRPGLRRPRDLCCAFLAIRYMKPDQPGVPMWGLAKAASRAVSTMAMTA
jgi:hypothetical protein